MGSAVKKISRMDRKKKKKRKKGMHKNERDKEIEGERIRVK